MQKRNNSNNNIFHSESQIVVQKIFYFSHNYIKDLVSYWKVYFQTKPSADVKKMVNFIFSFNEEWVKIYTRKKIVKVCCLIKKSRPLSLYGNK